jgi:multidrug efflux pump
LRPGLVVALSIPLVLAMTFAVMKYLGIDLHKISLGALILALGLLVDDAIIAVEMMAVKMEQGFSRVRAAAFAYTSTAFPMLSGTLITAAGFLPIATAASSTGEYTRSMFQVIAIALLLSWIAAVVFVPLLGYKLLPENKAGNGEHATRDVYGTRFYRAFRRLVEACVTHRWLTIGATLAAFAGAVVLFGTVPQQFFPQSSRLELVVDLKLPEGASVEASNRAAARMEEYLARQEGLENYTAYVGSGAPRFYLAFDQQLPAASLAQFVLNTKDLESRERIRAGLLEMLPREFSDVRWRVNRLENGPPVGYVLQYRISGPDRSVARGIADQVAAIMRANPYAEGVHLDTFEPSKIIKAEIEQDRARALGVSSRDIAQVIDAAVNGAPVTDLREDNKLIQIQVRGPGSERSELPLLGSLAIPTPTGATVPLSQLARLEYGFEDGILWRRDRVPTITVRGDVYADIQPPQVMAMLTPQVEKIKLPRGYHIKIGGTVEDAAKGSNSVNAGMPLFVLVVFTVLMVQLGSFSRTLLVILTAPLGIIGVPVFLLLFGKPFGFVAMLGTIALSGMIMRNSLILVDQIEQDLRAGHSGFDAIVGATVRRLRPIVLTAAAAVLAMIPLTGSVFFGPTAVVIMGGLIAATALTLLFLPALYAAWFRVRREAPAKPQPVESAPV